MFFTEEKLQKRIKELAEYRYRDPISIESFECQEDAGGNPGAGIPDSGQWRTIRVGDFWRGRDLYLWLHTQVYVPETWDGRRIVGLFDFGRTGGGNNSGFESLLYVNGAPFQGVDSNHKEVVFSNLHGGRVDLHFRLWSGLEGGGAPQVQEHKLARAALAWLDESVDDLYFTSRACLESILVLGNERAERAQMLTDLNRAFQEIDWSDPGTDTFYVSVQSARDALASAIQKWQKSEKVTIHAVGHTHIDVAWLWRLKHTREKAARSWSTVLRLMEQFPEYTFLQTQPQLYDYLKTDYPDIYARIKERIQDGRWEAAGAMWLEADCNIPSGESLVRQLVMGMRFFQKQFGVSCTYLWLPDVFGYSWALPQILKSAGIEAFVTTKISWNEYNRMPHDTFWWRGIDGSEILAHFITTPSDGRGYTYNGLVSADSVKATWTEYRDKSINQDLIIAYGYGDGGGGVNREMIEMRRRLDAMPGIPNVRTSRVDAYLQNLATKVRSTDQYVHTWDGELYLEYHRGTYTSQAFVKKQNRNLELLLRRAEWMAVYHSVRVQDWSTYPQRQLESAWKILLRNQFHDIIPGSSIREVYEDARAEYQVAMGLLQAACRDVGISSNSTRNVYLVANTLPWTRSDLIQITVQESSPSGVWKDENGQILAAQREGDTWSVQPINIPPMSFSKLYFEPEASDSVTAKADGIYELHADGVISPFYDIRWNTSGQLVRIYDLDSRREVLVEGECANVFQVFEDKPVEFDAWNVDLFYQEKMRTVTKCDDITVIEVGPLRAVVRFHWSYANSTITQDLTLYSNTRRIDFRTTVDWHENQQLLKVAFPVDIRATEATYDIQFGNVKRPTHWNTSWDYAKFETVAHQWVDLSEEGYGISLLNDCKYGHDIKDHVIRLSLIKSAIDPDFAADQGLHEFTYALFPHKGSWVDAGTAKDAWYLNEPLHVHPGTMEVSGHSLFRLSSEHVMIDAVKKSEDGDEVVLRIHEFAGHRGPLEITSDFGIDSWQECNLLERPTSDRYHQSQIDCSIKPYEIKTFLITMN